MDQRNLLAIFKNFQESTSLSYKTEFKIDANKSYSSHFFRVVPAKPQYNSNGCETCFTKNDTNRVTQLAFSRSTYVARPK